MPSSVLNNQVPHSLLYPTKPLYVVSPHVFGCTCFVHDLSLGRDKMFPRAIKCVFLGYSRVQKRYHCYSPTTHLFYTSVDVTFFEDISCFANSDVPLVELDQVLLILVLSLLSPLILHLLTHQQWYMHPLQPSLLHLLTGMVSLMREGLNCNAPIYYLIIFG